MIAANRLARFTLRRVLLGDMLLNWLLTGLLILTPATVDGLLGETALAPLWVYQSVGAAFALFAAWQLTDQLRGRVGAGGLIFAAALAEGPVVPLTAALVFAPLALRPAARAVLWVGNIYMLFLGVWYLFVARRVMLESGGRNEDSRS